MRYFLAASWGLLVAGCSQVSTMPLSNDTVMIRASAAPVCGVTGAQDVATRAAAIETLKRGFDRFMIVDAGYQNNVRVVGNTPVSVQTYGTATGTTYGNTTYVQGRSTSTVTGGYPIVAGSHDQGIVVRMFQHTHPEAANAINARSYLGPDFHRIVRESGKTTTC